MLGSQTERPEVTDKKSIDLIDLDQIDLDQIDLDQIDIDQIDLAHRYYPGDQPSTTILIEKLTPNTLGKLIALYEHKVFVMATIWNINPFDQWGVELGKEMAEDALVALKSEKEVTDFDASTNGLMNLVKASSYGSDSK